MSRTNYDSTLYVPTMVDAEQCRHIIPHKDGDPLCGAEFIGQQFPPHSYQRHSLCPRCVQRHIRAMRGIRLEDLWS